MAEIMLLVVKMNSHKDHKCRITVLLMLVACITLVARLGFGLTSSTDGDKIEGVTLEVQKFPKVIHNKPGITRKVAMNLQLKITNSLYHSIVVYKPALQPLIKRSDGTKIDLSSGTDMITPFSKENFIVVPAITSSTIPYDCNISSDGATTTLSGAIGDWFWWADKFVLGQYTFSVIYNLTPTTSQALDKTMKKSTGLEAQQYLLIGRIEAAPIQFMIRSGAD